MKLIVRKFAANISSWSNKEVAEFLNSIIDPRSADTVIQAADISEENMKKIQDKLGGTPKLPAKFKEIYQQFKSVKIKEDKKENPKPAPKPKAKRWSNNDILKAGRMALKICREILGQKNAVMCTRILEDDGQIDIDLGYGVANYPINSEKFYYSRSMYNEYNQKQIARICIFGGFMEIEGNKSNYSRDLSNPSMVIPCIKKHLKECIQL